MAIAVQANQAQALEILPKDKELFKRTALETGLNFVGEKTIEWVAPTFPLAVGVVGIGVGAFGFWNTYKAQNNIHQHIPRDAAGRPINRALSLLTRYRNQLVLGAAAGAIYMTTGYNVATPFMKLIGASNLYAISKRAFTGIKEAVTNFSLDRWKATKKIALHLGNIAFSMHKTSKTISAFSQYQMQQEQSLKEKEDFEKTLSELFKRFDEIQDAALASQIVNPMTPEQIAERVREINNLGFSLDFDRGFSSATTIGMSSNGSNITAS